MAEARFDGKTGAWILEDGTPVTFLPELPAESPPYELIFTHPTHAAANHADGHMHYLIGGDPKVVEQIVQWYADQGHPVPDGYAQAAADHAAAVEKAAAPPAG
jgi:hypothetical protein